MWSDIIKRREHLSLIEPLQGMSANDVPKLSNSKEIIKRDWSKVYSIVSECKISKAFCKGGQRGNYGGNIVKENDILYGIVEAKKFWNCGSFDTCSTVDHTLRYRFYVESNNKKTIILTQYFLHYDGQKQNWMEINPREVYIKLV